MTLPASRRPWMTAVSRVLPLCLLSISIAGCDGLMSQSEEDLIDRAERYEAEGDFPSAVIEYRNVLQENPEHAEVRLRLGRLYLRVGDLDSAITHLERAAKLGMPTEQTALPIARARQHLSHWQDIQQSRIPEDVPDDVAAELHAIAGLAHLELGERDRADDLLASAQRLSPDLAAVSYLEARKASIEGDLARAETLAEMSVTQDPEYGVAWSLWGDIVSQDGRLDDAEHHYGQAIAHRPNIAFDLYKRSMIRLQRGDDEGAGEDVTALRRAAPDHAYTHYARGLIEFRNGDYDVARLALQDAVRANPDMAQAHYYLGISQLRAGQLEQADRSFRLFLDLRPDSTEAVRWLAAARLMNDDQAGAVEVLARAAARHPGDVEIEALLARVRQDGENLTRALRSSDGNLATTRAVAAESSAAMEPSTVPEGVTDGSAGAQESAADTSLGALPRDLVIPIFQALQSGDYQSALDQAEQLSEQYPEHPAPYTLKGNALLGLGRDDDALQQFQRAMEVNPGDAGAGLNLAAISMQAGEEDEARRLLREVLERNPENLQVGVQLARLEAAAGNYRGGVSALERVREHRPNDVQAVTLLAEFHVQHNRLPEALSVLRGGREQIGNRESLVLAESEVLARLDRHDENIEFLEQARRDHAESVDLHYRLARSYDALGQAEAVRDSLRRVIDLDAEHAPAKLALMRNLAAAEQYDEARSLLAELEEVAPDHPFVLAQRGEFHLQDDEPEQAVHAFQRALEQRPDPGWSLRLARAQHLSGDAGAAVDTLRQTIEQTDGFQPDMSHALANLLVGEDRHDEAVSVYRRLIDDNSDDVVSLNNLAWLLREENPSEARELAERALQLAPDSVEVMDTLAKVLIRQGEPQRAVELLRDAAREAPDQPMLQYSLGVALLEADDQVAGRRVLEELIEAHPDYRRRDEIEELLGQ